MPSDLSIRDLAIRELRKQRAVTARDARVAASSDLELRVDGDPSEERRVTARLGEHDPIEFTIPAPTEAE